MVFFSAKWKYYLTCVLLGLLRVATDQWEKLRYLFIHSAHIFECLLEIYALLGNKRSQFSLAIVLREVSIKHSGQGKGGLFPPEKLNSLGRADTCNG